MLNSMEEDVTPPRRAKRVSIDSDIEFEKSIHLISENIVYSGRGRDISSGGLGLVNGERLEVGSVIKIYLPFDGKGTIVPVFGEVVWSEEIDGQFRSGVRFLA